MYDREVIAPDGAKLTLSSGDQQTTVDLYSAEGQRMLAALWVKVACQRRLLYDYSWLGIPIIQFPETVLMMQELLWKQRPDVIVECGLAHGGSAIMYASICELLGKGRVVGVDVEVRKYNRVALDAHPLRDRIQIVEGSSIADQTFDQVRRATQGAQTVLVILDSHHSREHVRSELELYHQLVTPGSYLVAMDGAQAHVWDVPAGKPEWRHDNPLGAIHDFLARHDEFEIDEHYTRTFITSSPDGFLRRRRVEDP